MKKLLIVLCAAALSLGAYAQKGTSAVGLNLNVTPSLEKNAKLTNFGVAAKYQYSFTDGFRGEVDLGYDFKAKGISVFEAGINLNYLFNIGEKFKIYPIVGVGYANLKASFGGFGGWDEDDDEYYGYGDYDDEGGSASVNKIYVNAGLGLEYDLTEHFAVNLEAKYQYIKDFSRMPISIGVAYKF